MELLKKKKAKMTPEDKMAIEEMNMAFGKMPMKKKPVKKTKKK